MADLIKDVYNPNFVDRLAAVLKDVYAAFDAEKFNRFIFQEDWTGLEFKQRMRRLTQALHVCLPESYGESLNILRAAAPRFKGLPAMIFPDFVEVYGLEEPELSIAALEHFTPFSSSEFAVRPFIIRYPDSMLKQLKVWTTHESEHVRRLASEGSRPRLPWAMALPSFKKDPSPLLPILELLKVDPSEYVRRSVANHLNDISKDHPGTVLQLARDWSGLHPDTDWIIKHGCRTLLKKCDPAALAIFGLSEADHVSVHDLEVSPGIVRIGETVEITFVLRNEDVEPKKLRMEYAIEFLKSRGTSSRKLFKMSEKSYGTGEFAIRSTHSFRQMTTRTHYPGNHHISIVVNGKVLAERSFELLD